MNAANVHTSHQPIPRDTDRVATLAVDAAFAVHMNLGPGLLESIYETCLAYELCQRGLSVQRQLELPVRYDGLLLESGFRLDLLVNDCLIIEVKAIEQILPVHQAQVMTYLKLADLRLGLLVNFNVKLIRDGIKRIVI